MEEASFTRYIRRKREGGRSGEIEVVVNAYLCEVTRLDEPQESNRNPTWFSAEKAKRRLRADRNADHGAEIARVVDAAIARLQRSPRAIITVVRALPK